jgi:hypothetical protein
LAIAGLCLGLAALVTFGKPLPALRVMLELLTAAGLLRLSAELSWATIAATAALIVVRRAITRSLFADLLTPWGPRASRTT